MANCTYAFKGPDGKRVVIEGQAAFKAFLAEGGLQRLAPGAAAKMSPGRAPYAWTQQSRNENGPVYVGRGFSVEAIRKLNAETDFEDDNGLPFGHAAHVQGTPYRFAILNERGDAIGFMDAEVNDFDEIDAVHDIEMKDKRQGVGRRVIETVMANAYDGVRIIDVVPDAVPFWDRMGAGFYDQYQNTTLDWDTYQRESVRSGRTSAEGAARSGQVRTGQEAQAQEVRFSPGRRTESPEFKAWFGDSKVVDKEGKPLVVYHGTALSGYVDTTDIKAFDHGRVGDRWNADSRGFFFTNDKRIANYYATADRDYRNPGNANGAVYPAYLSIKNPLTIVIPKTEDVISYWDSNESSIQEKAAKGNHDGVVLEDRSQKQDGEFVRSIVAFHPEQIKSAIGNNGQFDPTNPDIRMSLGRQTESPEFKAWFGDSKVVDKEGKPLVVYHGTSADFTEFKQGDGAAGKGIYFSPDARVANKYASLSGSAGGGRVVPVYLNLKNPYVLRDTDKLPPRKQLKARGYDGVVYTHEWNDGTVDTEYVAFDPTQIKSAIGNNGAFDPTNPDIRMSLGRLIDDTIAKVDHAVDGLSNMPNQFDYLKDRYLALGRVARVDEIVKEIRKAFETTDPANKQAVYDYLTTKGASASAIPNAEIRAMAQRIKKTINYVGDQLVARGLLDQQARDHYRDQYLPRMYLRYMLSDQDYKIIGMGKKPSDMGYLKHRKDIPTEIREVVLGEVKDPAFLSANAIGRAMRDVALLDWMGKISQNNDWVFPEIFVNWQGKRVTAYWLRSEADRIEQQSAHYTPANKTLADQRVAAMRQLANQTLGQMSQIDHKRYKQIPDTRRYGLLRGMWVRKEIFDDIMGASQIVNADPTWFEDWFGFGGRGTQLTQWWKFTKVALNPPGQIRNFLSNMVMLQLSGVGLHKLPFRLIQAAREITSNGKYWQVAKKYGVTESTFTAQEMFRIKRDLIELEAKQGKLNHLRWLMAAGARFLDGVSNLYQFSEALGKTIKIIDEMEAGKSEAEAALEAQKWLFDYSLVPQSVRIARNAPVGMPFLTYQVKVLPRLLEVAAKHPWRFLPWAGLLYGMEMYVASLFGVDDDELRKLKKALPEWLQDRGHTVFLPVRDKDGRLQVADVGYFFPWTFYSTAMKHAGEGNMKKLLADDIFGQFSAPIIGAGSALISNYDNFTKKPIYNEGDPVAYQAAAIANYTYDLMAPPFLSSHGFASPMGLLDKRYGGKIVQAETGTTNKFGDPKATKGQAIGALIGANFYGMDPEHTRVTNMQVMNAKVLEAEKLLRARLMDRGLSPEQRQAYLRDYQARMADLTQEMLTYAKESEVPDALKVKK